NKAPRHRLSTSPRFQIHHGLGSETSGLDVEFRILDRCSCEEGILRSSIGHGT
ncbi:14765_t:CDS:1, partial [Cetraspora pellucida]